MNFNHDDRIVRVDIRPSLVQPQDSLGDSVLARLLGEREVQQIVTPQFRRRGICGSHKNTDNPKKRVTVGTHIFIIV